MCVRGAFLAALGLALSACGVARGQDEPVKLSLRVALIDKELRVRAVPKTLFLLERAGAENGKAALRLTTGFDQSAHLVAIQAHRRTRGGAAPERPGAARLAVVRAVFRRRTPGRIHAFRCRMA